MELSIEQRKTACLFWANLMIAVTLDPRFESKVVPFMMVMEREHHQHHINALFKNKPDWLNLFIHNLFHLLDGTDTSTKLFLDVYPQGLLKQALDISGLTNNVFLLGKFQTSFDDMGNFIIDDLRQSANNDISNLEANMKGMRF